MRTVGSSDLFVFPALRHYIRGESETVGRSVQLYAALSYPAEIPKSERPEDWPAGRLFVPTGNRMGHCWVRARDGRQKVLRAVHLRAFTFFLAFFEPEGGSAERREFSEEFLHGHPSSRLTQ